MRTREQSLLLCFDAGPFLDAIRDFPVAAAEVQDAVKLRMTGQLQALDLPIFHDVEPDRLRHFTGTMEVRSFAPKTTLFAYGDAGDDFFILLQGEVTILDKGGAEIVTLKTKGDYFGELALARAEPRSATVIAASPAVCACVDGARFRDIFLESPAARAEFEIKAMREKASAGAVLSHPVTRDPFRKFLDSELASENHECWDAIADYRRRVAASEGEITDADEANAMARTLYDAFIAPGCDTQVNVSSKMAGKLRAKIYDESAGDAALFDGVAAEIDRMLRGNMMRFAAKAEFKAALEERGFHGPQVQTVHRAWLSSDGHEVVARLRVAASLASERYHVHPAVLDGAIQLIGFVGEAAPDKAWVPAGIRRASGGILENFLLATQLLVIELVVAAAQPGARFRAVDAIRAAAQALERRRSRGSVLGRRDHCTASGAKDDEFL